MGEGRGGARGANAGQSVGHLAAAGLEGFHPARRGWVGGTPAPECPAQDRAPPAPGNGMERKRPPVSPVGAQAPARWESSGQAPGVRVGGTGEEERRERVIRDVTCLVITDSSAWIGRAGGRPAPPGLWPPEPLLEIRAAAAARGSGLPRGREPARRRPGARKLHARAPRSLLSGNTRVC